MREREAERTLFNEVVLRRELASKKALVEREQFIGEVQLAAWKKLIMEEEATRGRELESTRHKKERTLLIVSNNESRRFSDGLGIKYRKYFHDCNNLLFDLEYSRCTIGNAALKKN